MKRASLLDVALEIAAILGPDDCLLIGGLAVGAHGYVRATTDVDLLTRLALAEAQKRLEARGLRGEIKQGDVLDGDLACLQLRRAGVRVDILPPLVPIAWGKGIELRTKSRLRVVDLEGLLRLKLRAQGPKDLMDTAALILRHPDLRQRGRELALAYRVQDKLDLWLDDPRLKAELKESAAEEATAGAIEPDVKPVARKTKHTGGSEGRKGLRGHRSR